MRKKMSIFIGIFLVLCFLFTPLVVTASYKEEALGYFYRAQGSASIEEQITYYHKAIEVEPEFIEAYINLGGLYLRRNKPAEALSLLEDAHNRHPEHETIKQYLVIAYINVGVNYYSEQRTQDEIAAYENALALDPVNVMAKNNLSNAYNTLGVALFNQKRMRVSWEAFNKALELNSNNHTAKSNLRSLFKGVPPPDTPTPVPDTPTPTPTLPVPVSTSDLTTEDIKNMILQSISTWENQRKIGIRGDEKIRIVQAYLSSVEECNTDALSLQRSNVEEHLFFYLDEVHYEGQNPEFVVCDPLQ